MDNQHPDPKSLERMRQWLADMEEDLESASNFDLLLRLEATDALADEFRTVMDEKERARVSALSEKIWGILESRPDDDELPPVEQAHAQQMGLFD